jgi:hypothetical protein
MKIRSIITSRICHRRKWQWQESQPVSTTFSLSYFHLLSTKEASWILPFAVAPAAQRDPNARRGLSTWQFLNIGRKPSVRGDD